MMILVSCDWCDEEIESPDDCVSIPLIGVRGKSRCYYHVDCNIRMIVGSVAHQEHRCSCYLHGGEADEAGMSKREAARMAAAVFRLRQEAKAWAPSQN